MVRDEAIYKVFVQHLRNHQPDYLTDYIFFDPASHLRLMNICNFRTLDRFRRSWRAAVVPMWDLVPADLLLQGDCVGWRTVLKDIQRTIMM